MGGRRDTSDVAALRRRIEGTGIRDLYVHAGPLEHDGTLPPARNAYPRARWLIAAVHRDAGRYPEAIAQFSSTLVSHPEFGVAHWGLAETYREIGRTDAAIARGRARSPLHSPRSAQV